MASVRSIVRPGLYLGVLIAAVVIVTESLDFSVEQTVRQVAKLQAAAKSAIRRPGYLASLPELTAKDFDAARLVPVTVAGKAAEAQMGISASAQDGRYHLYGCGPG